MIKLAFCEPDPEIFQQLSELLKKHKAPEPLKIKGFLSPAEFIHYVDYLGPELDILICNIVMEDYNGIQLMYAVQRSLPNIQIIFASQYREMVFDAYSVRHVAFIPVPVNQRHFDTAMCMAVSNVAETRKQKYLTLTAKGLVSRIAIRDIVYLESNLRTLIVHTKDNRFEYTYQLEAVKQFLDGSFVHCHKSFIVNMEHVAALDGTAMSFVLKNGETVPISSRRAAQARKDFEEYTSHTYID